MADETEELKLDPDTVKKGVENFIKSGNYYLVAEYENKVRGCLGVTAQHDLNTDTLIGWLESVFVEKDFRKKGFFKAMYSKNIEISKQKGFKFIRLYVETENKRA